MITRRFIAAALALLLSSAVAIGAEQVAVVTGVIYPGQTIAPEQVRVAVLKRRLATGTRVARSAQDLVGQVARRTILPDRLIDLSAVRQAHIVEAGKPVRVSYRTGTLSISMTAMSLSSGAAGDVVKLRNATSGKVFAGTVLEDGTVYVSSGP